MHLRIFLRRPEAAGMHGREGVGARLANTYISWYIVISVRVGYCGRIFLSFLLLLKFLFVSIRFLWNSAFSFSANAKERRISICLLLLLGVPLRNLLDLRTILLFGGGFFFSLSRCELPRIKANLHKWYGVVSGFLLPWFSTGGGGFEGWHVCFIVSPFYSFLILSYPFFFPPLFDWVIYI